MVARLTRDRTRFRKTYSFYRQEPHPATLYLETNTVTVVSETIVREGSVFVDQFSARPSPSFQGALFYCTDVCESFFYSGSAWRPFFGAGKLGTVPSDPSAWTQYSTYGTGTLVSDRDAWLMSVPIAELPPGPDPALLVWVSPSTMQTGTVTTVTLAVQNSTSVTSSVSAFGAMYVSGAGTLFDSLVLTMAKFDPHNEDGDVAVFGTVSGVETALTSSVEKGSNQEVWLRYVVTSSLTSSLTASMGGNGGTTWRPIGNGSFVTAPPVVLSPAVGLIIVPGMDVSASVRFLSYDEVQVSA